MNTAKITTGRLLLAAATFVLGSCASPRSSDGLLDHPDGLPESVVQLEHPEDQKAVRLHLEKIEMRQKALDLAERRDARLRQLVEAGRASPADTVAGTIALTSARVDILDARLALARSGLLSKTKPTMVDTDGDGLPDLRHSPLSVSDLLDEKIEALQEQHAARKLAHKRVEMLWRSGRVTDADLRSVEQRMLKAESAWIAVKNERGARTQ